MAFYFIRILARISPALGGAGSTAGALFLIARARG
jgi:hypothetical protein